MWCPKSANSGWWSPGVLYIRLSGSAAEFVPKNSSAGHLFGIRRECYCRIHVIIIWKYYRQILDIRKNLRRSGLQKVGRFLLSGRQPAQMWLVEHNFEHFKRESGKGYGKKNQKIILALKWNITLTWIRIRDLRHRFAIFPTSHMRTYKIYYIMYILSNKYFTKTVVVYKFEKCTLIRFVKCIMFCSCSVHKVYTVHIYRWKCHNHYTIAYIQILRTTLVKWQ